jgi:hypothetical protein
MRLPITGGCQCGAVRYEIAAAPLTLYACHCSDCQRQTGSAFALSLMVARAAVRVTNGEPAVWERPGSHTSSGTPAACLFCAACGARLYHLPSRNQAMAVVKPGTLDDTSWLKPVGHIWTRSAQPWVIFEEGTLRYEGQPPDLAALNKAWQAQQRG